MNNSKKLISGILTFLIFISVHGQQESRKSYSVFTGGMVLKNSILSTTKLGYEFNNFGIIADFTYDDYRETWQDGSKSYFKLPALSASGRYYLRPMGRSLFAELNLGIGNPTLITRENGNERNKSDYLPISGFGVGWRFGKKPKGIFGEIGFRSTVSLKDSHLYTTEKEPNTEGVENISYQSWLFEKGKFSSQIYLGIGYSF